MARVDVFCVGVGMRPRDHLTLEGMRAFRASRKVFYASELEGFAELLAEHAIHGEDITQSLLFGGGRGDAYETIAKRILSESEAGPVAWATLGSPAVVCGVTVAIESAASKSGRVVTRCLSVSSVDEIASQVGLDIGGAGWTVMPASHLVSAGARPSPHTGCIVMMVARAETALHVLDARLKPGALDRLASCLAEVYPPTQPAILVTCSRNPGEPSRRFDTTIAELPKAVTEVDPWSSLFVPPVEALIEPAELERLFDYAHAVRNYETPLERLLRRADEGTVA